MGHHSYLCRRVKRNLPADETFQVTVKVKQGENVVYEKTYYLAVKVVGGPLRIEVVFLADNEENALKLHRSTEGSVNFEFPWYCYDFGYNPFLYRTRPHYTENNSAQKINVFKASPRWIQPVKTKIRYHLSSPSVFLNPDSEIADKLEGGKDPQNTRGLPRTTHAIIGNDEIFNSSGQSTGDLFTLHASYEYRDDLEDGECSTNIPFYFHATDHSNAYYLAGGAIPEIGESVGNRDKYTQFRVHRPLDTNVWPADELYETFFIRKYPSSGYSGGAIFHLLTDHLGEGIPGVRIQERFRNNPPEGSLVNVWYYWITKKKGSTFFGYSKIPTDIDGIFGEDFFSLPNSWWGENTNEDFILEGHEYWAGTSKNNYTQPYSGLFVGQYRIVVRYNPQKDPERYPRHEKTANGTGMKGG